MEPLNRDGFPGSPLLPAGRCDAAPISHSAHGGPFALADGRRYQPFPWAVFHARYSASASARSG